MKKLIVLLLALSLLVLTGCKCKHEWQEADCVNPKTCTRCKETQGEPLGHTWQDATCSAPKTCSVCGETEGEALGHTWVDATCSAPKTCSVCGETEGEALGHTWVDATCSAPKTCSVCGETEGEPLVRTDLGFTPDEMANNLNTTLQLLGYHMDYLGVDEDGWPTYDVLDADGNYTNVYLSLEPTEDGAKVLSVFVAAEDVTDNNAVTLMGVVAGASLSMVDENYDLENMSKVFAGEPTMIEGVPCFIAESCNLVAEMQVHSDFAVFWVYPAE